MVHFHGGGYCIGSARTIRGWAAHLSAQAGCRVVLPEYRLAPEHPYPAGLQDARAVVAAVEGPVVLSGDSAGGGLALALVLSMRDAGKALPAGCILLSPWLDVRPEVQDTFNAWTQAASRATVWESGCHSWYTTASGRNTNNWPDHTFLYRYRVRRFDLAAYRVMPSPPAATASAA